MSLTKDELRESLEEELLWRTEEINFFKRQIGCFDEELDRDKYRKGLVLILYSHLEGFLRVALTTYAQFLTSLNMKRKVFDYSLVATSMDAEFRAYENKNVKSKLFNNKRVPEDKKIHSLYRRINFLESSEQMIEKNLEIKDTVIDTESNVWYIVLQKNLYRMGLPIDLFSDFANEIDALVNRRNSIAHGSRTSGVSERDYLRWETNVISIMNEITRKIYYFISNNLYLKER